MPALVNELEWPLAAGSSAGTPRSRRAARIAAHFLAWPLLVKVGLLSGFALAAGVQKMLAMWI